MNTLTIIGLGAFPGHLTKDAEEALSTGRVLLQTRRCYLSGQGREFASCDDLYQQAWDYDELNGLIARRAVEMAKEEDACFAMPSSPLGKALFAKIIETAKAEGVAARVIPGVRYGQAALAASGLCFAADPYMLCAADAEGTEFDVSRPLVVEELDNRLLAGTVKLALMEYYPDDQEIQLAQTDGDQYVCRTIALSQLDRQEDGAYLHTTCAILPGLCFEQLQRRGVRELDQLVKRLRAPGGCPWDREQTIQSLRGSLLEEAYEVAEAIDMEEPSMLCEELGDLLLQVVFLSRISDEHGDFTLRDVTTDICKKLVYRHPHVFGQVKAETTGQVLENWDKLKKAEKHQTTQTQVLKSVPKPLPALLRGAKVQKKAANVGFDWNTPLDALKKVREETDELEAELTKGAPEAAFEELGDLLFAAVNTARLAGIDPELALTRATDKFIGRFERMEDELLKGGGSFETASLEQLDAIWERIKHQ